MNEERLKDITRRHLLKMAGYGVGNLALASMLAETGMAAGGPDGQLRPVGPDFAPKAKRIVFLFMAGAPSQLDLYDPKPMLNKHDGEPCPEELIKGERFAFIKGRPKLLGSPHTFEKVGQSGIELGDNLVHIKKIADEMCLVRSMHTDQFNHAPAQIFANTGFQIPGRPSMGSWLTYGLGTESKDLPGFVVLISGQNNPDGGKSCWGSGFLPTQYQGVEFRSKGDPVLFVTDPPGLARELRRKQLDAIGTLNRAHNKVVNDPEIDTRIASYELAYRMQSSVPELMDVSKESPETHALYGTTPGQPSFANNCLLARRLLERGVRFVQLYHWGWDQHGDSESNDLTHGLGRQTLATDQASAALVMDLKRLGMLEDTLVVWGGEFGRTPMNEGRNGVPFKGRDHHPRAYSVWLAGGGVKPGTIVGQTDDFGYNIVEDPVHVNDLNATILHLMGIDHTRLTYKSQGRDFRLTDVSGEIIDKMLK
ncbi:MAG: DUF1501 domain-containing protein [Fimbriimonadaceae bacterium]|nr:DUF1501 domain-containing protein [Fimbriimonadaceae bacterium]